MARGILIVVEGLDRAGKSSQCERLRESLQKAGHSAKYIRLPGIPQFISIFYTDTNEKQIGPPQLES